MNSSSPPPESPLSHCPAPLGNETSGQSFDGAGAPSLKSLARKVLQRQSPPGHHVPIPSHPSGQIAPAAITWGAAEWRACFNEVSAIGEWVRGLSRAAAEVRAYSACIIEWCRLHPIPEGVPSVCCYCQETWPSVSIVPVLNGAGGHFWIHLSCFPAHIEVRRQAAICALSLLGLTAPTGYRL